MSRPKSRTDRDNILLLTDDFEFFKLQDIPRRPYDRNGTPRIASIQNYLFRLPNLATILQSTCAS